MDIIDKEPETDELIKKKELKELKEEQKELRARLFKLEEKISTLEFIKLDPYNQALLKAQLFSMKEYNEILSTRVWNMQRLLTLLVGNKQSTNEINYLYD